MFAFLNRAVQRCNALYDSYLDWRFSQVQWQKYRLAQQLLSLEERIKDRRLIAWRWEPDSAFKRRVGHMDAKEFKSAKNTWPDFVERVGRVFRDTPYGYDPANTFYAGESVLTMVGTQLNNLPKDIEEFKAHEPKRYLTDSTDIKRLYAVGDSLPHADNVLVPGSDKTFAELGLDIDATVVVEPAPEQKEDEPNLRAANDVVDNVLLGLLNRRSDNPNELKGGE